MMALAIILGPSPGAAQLRIPDLIPVPAPSCRLTGAQDSDVHALSPADRMTVSAVPGGATFVRVISAGNRIALRAGAGARGPYLVSVSAKNASESPFFDVCRQVLWRPAAGSTFVATAPRLWLGEVWRVEVQTTSASSGATLQILRAPNSETNPEDPAPSEALNDAFGLLCLDSAPIEVFPRRLTQGFGGRVRLDVNIAPTGDGLTPVQQGALTREILLGVALWVQGCGDCRVEHLAIVSVNGQTWVRRGFWDWYRTNLAAGATMASAAAGLEDSLRGALEPVVQLEAGVPGGDFPHKKELSAYEAVADPAASFSRLCTMSQVTGQTPTLSTMRQALCDAPHLPALEAASIRVRFRADGRTYCGQSSDIVACRADNVLTEYNAANYRFDVAAPGAAPIGHGPIEIDFLPVLVHEMGHWIGLGHLNEGESIMAPTLATARCIDLPTVSALLHGGGREPVTGPSPLLFTGRAPAR